MWEWWPRNMSLREPGVRFCGWLQARRCHKWLTQSSPFLGYQLVTSKVRDQRCSSSSLKRFEGPGENKTPERQIVQSNKNWSSLPIRIGARPDICPTITVLTMVPYSRSNRESTPVDLISNREMYRNLGPVVLVGKDLTEVKINIELGCFLQFQHWFSNDLDNFGWNNRN